MSTEQNSRKKGVSVVETKEEPTMKLTEFADVYGLTEAQIYVGNKKFQNNLMTFEQWKSALNL